jgi:hypothetical protein
MNQSLRSRQLDADLRRQRGVAIVLFTIAMVVMLGVAGLALDGAHSMLNKTRLQTMVDAAALSAAKTLDETDDRILATADGLAMISTSTSDAGNGEIAASYAGGQLSLSIQYSNLLHPFTPGTTPERYVRVRATNLRLPGWLVPVLGIAEKIVGASAVAGPSPTIDESCNLAPMMVCGDPNPAVSNYGYTLGEADVLKASTNSFDVGPGNFQLVRLGGGMGGADVREAMAGGYEQCWGSGDVIPTEPGNTVGPVVQGLNTRFGIYSGPMNGSQQDYPADVVVGEPDPLLTYEDCPPLGVEDSDILCWNGNPIEPYPVLSDPITYEFYDWDDYDGDVGSAPTPADPPTTAYGRRTMAVPVGDCTNTTNGQGDVPLLGFLCYHLLQPAEQHGNRSQVYGQFIEEGCETTGTPSAVPNSGPGPYIIQLYKDETADAS